jgi:hypothetical protein
VIIAVVPLGHGNKSENPDPTDQAPRLVIEWTADLSQATTTPCLMRAGRGAGVVDRPIGQLDRLCVGELHVFPTMAGERLGTGFWAAVLIVVPVRSAL